MGAVLGKTPEGASSEAQLESCIFCKIVAGKDLKTTLLYHDEDYVVFQDIHPASTHHYLIVPKKHLKDVKSLTYNDIPIVNRLVEIGKQVLEQHGGSLEASRSKGTAPKLVAYFMKRKQCKQEKVCIQATKDRFGFHWPPFTSISHLHLHVISPSTDMSMLGRVMYMPGSPWFSLVEGTIAYLERSRPAAPAS